MTLEFSYLQEVFPDNNYCIRCKSLITAVVKFSSCDILQPLYDRPIEKTTDTHCNSCIKKEKLDSKNAFIASRLLKSSFQNENELQLVLKSCENELKQCELQLDVPPEYTPSTNKLSWFQHVSNSFKRLFSCRRRSNKL
jgi:hypothetical protein